MQISQVPALLQKAWAASGTKNVIPVASQISVTPGAASLTDGFPPLTLTPLAAGGVPPYGADTNGILNWLSQICQWANAGGMYLYDGTFSAAIGGYPKGATLLKADGSGIWMSAVDNNTTDPDMGGDGWATIAVQNPLPAMTFAQVAALTSDQGPVMVTDMGPSNLYVWSTSQYFTGYRSVHCGEMPRNFSPTHRAWEMPVTGGTWSTSDPKQARLIALFQEYGLVVPSANWISGQAMISDLGSGNFKAPDLQNMFFRMAGTDADTANAAGPGVYKGFTIQAHTHLSSQATSTAGVVSGSGASAGLNPAMLATTSTGTAETAPQHVRVSATILV